MDCLDGIGLALDGCRFHVFTGEMSLDLTAGIHIDHNFTRIRQIAQA
jgi:hypothetical protein